VLYRYKAHQRAKKLDMNDGRLPDTSVALKTYDAADTKLKPHSKKTKKVMFTMLPPVQQQSYETNSYCINGAVVTPVFFTWALLCGLKLITNGLLRLVRHF
jgi:hypothetical protein